MRHFFYRSRSFKRIFSASNGGDVGEEEVKPHHKPTWKCFSFQEINRATDGFNQDNLVGRGGYAEVYRGALDNGQLIAVKKLTRASMDESDHKEKEFLTELGTVGHVRHPNVTSLLGCCVDLGLYLIFEFSSRGSVSSNLHGDISAPAMAWKLRYKIATGTARGLHYLHKECNRRIIHRDIKSSNILLTSNFEPQISDFGLAKWLPSEWTHRAAGPIEGTFGCVAPEYFTHGIVDEKTDVFAFGVFLFEIISGRKPVDRSHKSLLSWARPYLSEGMIEMLVDRRLGDDYDIGQLRTLAFSASLCIKASSSSRPSMTEVLDLIENGKEVSMDQWKASVGNEEEDLWGFEDLENDDDDDDDDDDEHTCSDTNLV